MLLPLNPTLLLLLLGETAATFTTQNVAEFNPRGAMPGSDLPAGELSMNQIMNLMNK